MTKRRSHINDRPLTNEERIIIERFLKVYPQPVALLIKAWPTLYTAGLCAGLSKEDLNQECCLGAVRAVKTFDHSRNVRFEFYAAHSMRNFVCVAIRKQNCDAMHNAIPGDASGSDDGGMWDFLEVKAREMEAAEFLMEQDRVASLKDRMNSALTTLSERERRFIRERWGMDDDGERLTYRELAVNHGLSKQRVEQLEKRSLSILNTSLCWMWEQDVEARSSS